MKLGLGSAQFGEKYGITNSVGSLGEKKISDILNIARLNNIKFIDTAVSYSSSEKLIGKLTDISDKFNIITKTPKFQNIRILNSDITKLRSYFFASLKKLNKKCLYALLIHRPEDLKKSNGEKLFDEMISLRKQKLVKKIGVSFSTTDSLNYVISKFPVDIIQIPVNIFNHDFLKNNMLKRLKAKKIEIHARSILLQGALLDEHKTDNNILIKLRPFLKRLTLELEKKKISVLRASILFVDQFKEIDVGIFGVLDQYELKQISIEHKKKLKNLDFLNKFSIDEKINNPIYWKKIL